MSRGGPAQGLAYLFEGPDAPLHVVCRAGRTRVDHSPPLPFPEGGGGEDPEMMSVQGDSDRLGEALARGRVRLLRGGAGGEGGDD